jgi:hypothetical protein
MMDTGSPRALGNLRDSDPGVSAYDATPLRNWALQTLDPLGIVEQKPPYKFAVTNAYMQLGGKTYLLGV